MRPKIENDVVYVRDESSSGWGMTDIRHANPHEIVPALIQIIGDLQDRIAELEKWRDRVVG